jgi:hypothetical protein
MKSEDVRFPRQLDTEELPGHWGGFVYSTYSSEARTQAKFCWPAEYERPRKGVIFITRTHKHHGTLYAFFIVIGDECLRSMMEGPKPIFELMKGYSHGEMERGENSIVVKVVDSLMPTTTRRVEVSCMGRQQGGPPSKHSPWCIAFYG